jgi:hypothetical protein
VRFAAAFSPPGTLRSLFLAIIPEQVGLGTPPAIKIGSGCGRLTAPDHHWVTDL